MKTEYKYLYNIISKYKEPVVNWQCFKLSKTQQTNLRVDAELVRKAREKGLNLRELLEHAIAGNLDKCPHCGQKLKKK